MAYTNPYPHQLFEQDIRMFLSERPAFADTGRKLLLGLAALFSVAALGYGVINYNALLRVFTPTETTVVSQTPLPTAQTLAVVATPAPTPTPEPIPSIPESTLSAGALNIAAPISWDTPFDEKTMLAKLPNGVVHFQGTAKPGQQGYVVITGHSSNYPWIKGQYNSIFAPLHKAVVGQTILVNYQNREYSYKVTKIYQVKPTELQILQQGEGSGLRLITCTPIGTSLRRLVVEAEQIMPSPANNTPFQATVLNGEIPAIR